MIPSTRNQAAFILTILGRAVSDLQLARVSQILAMHAVIVEKMERLSGPLVLEAGQSCTCTQLTISGDLENESALRAELLAAAQELSVDIAFQHESDFHRTYRLCVFDMDSTLIQGEVIDELARMAGVGDEVATITAAAMRGELNFDESFTRRAGLLKGLSAERALSLIDTIPLTEGAERLLQTLRFQGYKTAILSGGFTFFAEVLQRRLGFDYVYANTLDIEDGRVTGRVVHPIMNGTRKAELLTVIASREGIPLEEAVVVGDGANDLPMMGLAGLGVAFHAKPVVRQRANQSINFVGLDGILYLLGIGANLP
jgi:phosphoserine phosphatase